MIYVGECLPIFSSRSFIVSGCTFRYLVHFEFIFLYDVRTEKALAAHSSTLAWKIPWMEEPGRLPSMGSHSRARLKRLSSSSSMMLESVLVSVFYKWLTSFPSTTC